jgi:flagellar basal-body rod protein FlgB
LIKLFDGAVEHLTRGLVYAGRRHEVLAQNIANAETPGYRARDLVFTDSLRPQLAAMPADQRFAAPAGGPEERSPRLVVSGDRAAGPDGNDVQLDRQMARLAENTLFHHALVRILAGQFNVLKQAITGRV